MIQMYPKAVVLTNRHPFGGTEMMAQSLASALDANGYDSHIVSINDATFEKLSGLLKDPQLALVMTTGTLPLQVAVAGVPIWRAVPAKVDFITYIIDAWPYDAVRVEACGPFMADWQRMPNLHMVSLEANDARLIGARTHYMPSGAYPAPRRHGPKLNPGRLLVWASANKELAVTPVHDEFEKTIAANNVWSLDPGRIARAAEALRHTEVVHGLSAIAAALDEPIEEVMQPGALATVCAIDSCLKRYRRVKVVQALRGLPIDIYGENWQQHASATSPRFACSRRSPNHNHAFSHLCQHYAGLVQRRPELRPRHQRARGLGARARHADRRTTSTPAPTPASAAFRITVEDASIRSAAERLLEYRGEVPLASRERLGVPGRQAAGRDRCRSPGHEGAAMSAIAPVPINQVWASRPRS